VSRVRQLLRCLRGLAYGTRGIAMFSSAGGSAHEAVQLPSPASPMAVVDTIPWLEPLAAIFTAGDWGVAVLGRHAERLFRGGPRALVEFAAFERERHLGPANGDLRRTRWRDRIEKPEHARQFAERLLRAHRRQAFEHLVIIAPSEVLPVIEADLHSDLRDRLAGLVAQPDLERAPAPEVLRTVAPLLERARRDGITRTRPASERAFPAGASAVAGTADRPLVLTAASTGAAHRPQRRGTNTIDPIACALLGPKESTACP
jgi:hypothetical protein